MLPRHTGKTAALLLVWIGSWGVTDTQARFKRPVQVPNGLVLNCGACHIGPGTTRTLLNIPFDKNTREALNEGDKICSSCHSDLSGGGHRNAFGQAVEKGFLTEPGWNGDVTWGASLARLDSDGDGFTNGEELGDPQGTWRPGEPAPGDPWRITNPGDPASNPARRPQAPPPLPMDFDGDGKVGWDDFFLFVEGFGKNRKEEGFDARLDLNSDGIVNFNDFFLFAQSFGESAERVQARKATVPRDDPKFGVESKGGASRPSEMCPRFKPESVLPQFPISD